VSDVFFLENFRQSEIRGCFRRTYGGRMFSNTELLVFLGITTIFAVIRDSTKEEIIFRYIFSFGLYILIKWLAENGV
jgi:hypothetical protein